MDNETSVKLQFKNSVTGEKKLKEYANNLKKIRSYLTAIDTGKMKQIDDKAGSLKSVAKETENISDEAKKASKNFNLAFDYSIVKRFGNALSNTYKTMVKFTSRSSDYLENINLFQVAFDGNYRAAERFMNSMTEMYGLDESWAINTIGIFRQLANAMNISAEAGTQLSTLLTQMSVDISSLYNVDISRATSTLQSALAGLIKKTVWLALNLSNCWNTLTKGNQQERFALLV